MNKIEENIIANIAKAYDFDKEWELDAINYLKSIRLINSPIKITSSSNMQYHIPKRSREPISPKRSREPISPKKLVNTKLSVIKKYCNINKNLYYKLLSLYLMVLISLIINYIYY